MKNGDIVAPEDIPFAVVRAQLHYEDGSTQTFDAEGGTIYVEHGRPTRGEWHVDAEGQFCSFWPPSYRACYELRWIVEDQSVMGLRFRRGNEAYDGRYESALREETFREELALWRDEAVGRRAE